jgi:hypothetical protein
LMRLGDCVCWLSSDQARSREKEESGIDWIDPFRFFLAFPGNYG